MHKCDCCKNEVHAVDEHDLCRSVQKACSGGQADQE
jgi:hypothetical protein